MAVPPSYGDLGKAAKDLLNKGERCCLFCLALFCCSYKTELSNLLILFPGYNYGSAKLELKTKTANGVGVTAGGSSNLASGKINGSLETKWACKDSGLNGESMLVLVSTQHRTMFVCYCFEIQRL